MKITFDRLTRAVRESDKSIKTAPRQLIELTLLNNGVESTLATGESVTFKLKPKNITDIDPLVATTLTPANAVYGNFFSKEFSGYTVEALAFLNLNNTYSTDDKAAVVVDGYLLLDDGHASLIESDTFPVTLIPAKGIESDGTPTVVANPYVWLFEALAAGANISLSQNPTSGVIMISGTGGGDLIIVDGVDATSYRLVINDGVLGIEVV